MPQPNHGARPQSGTESTAQRVFDVVQAGLWALGAALALWFAINAPALSRARATADMRRALEIAHDDWTYCEKWGMAPGTAQHSTCLQDLAELRNRERQRPLEESDELF